MLNRIGILILFAAVLIGCKSYDQTFEPNSIDTLLYHEPYRPQTHFSPKEKWMNDPNGMVYHKDAYHLFYQHYPDSTV